MRTGAIVARFQVPALHKGHIHLIDTVLEKCDKLIVILGTKSIPDERNILSFRIRSEMLFELYPYLTIHEIRDHREDDEWSAHLDLLLDQYENVTLYGSRDSFIKFYVGRYSYQSIPELANLSGTQERESMIIDNNVDFRKGVIHGFNLFKKYLT